MNNDNYESELLSKINHNASLALSLEEDIDKKVIRENNTYQESKSKLKKRRKKFNIACIIAMIIISVICFLYTSSMFTSFSVASIIESLILGIIPFGLIKKIGNDAFKMDEEDLDSWHIQESENIKLERERIRTIIKNNTNIMRLYSFQKGKLMMNNPIVQQDVTLDDTQKLVRKPNNE